MIEVHLEDWEEEIFTHQKEFINEFFKEQDVWEVLTVHWNSIGMKVNFVLDCGQHCTTTFSMKQWLKYYESK